MTSTTLGLLALTFIGYSSGLVYSGYKYATYEDEAATAAAITAEQIKHNTDQQAANVRAAGLESLLATERQKSTTLNQQLEQAYAKVTDNCPVPPNIVRMLNQAINK